MARAMMDRSPISFLSRLLTTTTTPVFVHPMHWSNLHLRLLCVRGLDKELPLEQVFGRMADSLQKAPFVDHVLLFKELGNLDEYHYRCYIAIVRPVVDEDHVRRKPVDQSGGDAEEHLTSMCFEWLEQIYLQKGFPTRTGRWSLSDEPNGVFHLNFGNEKPQRLVCSSSLHNWPDENENSARFPIVAITSRTRDYYKPIIIPGRRLQDLYRWQCRRERADRDAEEIALLIALAQRHAEVLRPSRFAEDDLESRSHARLRVFHPVLLVITATTVRFIKANIHQEYLETLADPTRPLLHDLEIERSRPIDMTKDEGVSQLLSAMSALIDDYNMHMKPLLDKRLPTPDNPLPYEQMLAPQHEKIVSPLPHQQIARPRPEKILKQRSPNRVSKTPSSRSIPTKINNYKYTSQDRVSKARYQRPQTSKVD